MRVDMRSPNDTRLSLARAVRSCREAGRARCERARPGVSIHRMSQKHPRDRSGAVPMGGLRIVTSGQHQASAVPPS
jgi:hypothetical protein